MKVISAYFLLICYLGLQIKPVVPVLQDYIAHTYFKAEHIDHVHNALGNNHVHIEMGSAFIDTSESNSLNKNKSVINEQPSEQVAPEKYSIFSGINIPFQITKKYSALAENGYTQKVHHPPQSI